MRKTHELFCKSIQKIEFDFHEVNMRKNKENKLFWKTETSRLR